jgi:hypothetical protein
MGSSNWTYFTPHQEDIEQALQDLRRNVFETWDYHRFWLFLEVPEEAFDALDEISWTGTDQHLVEELAQVLAEKQIHVALPKPPQTIKEAQDRSDAQGTRSILDIERIASQPGMGVATALPRHVYRQFFGTEKPTREMIEQAVTTKGLLDDVMRWEAIYVIAFKNERPDEIFFGGCSGD